MKHILTLAFCLLAFAVGAVAQAGPDEKAEQKRYVRLFKQMRKAPEPRKAELLGYLADEAADSLKRPMLRTLHISLDVPASVYTLEALRQGKTAQTRRQAARLLYNLGDAAYVRPLSDLLASADTADVNTGYTMLLHYPSKSNASVARALEKCQTPEGRVACLRLLGSHDAESYFTAVWNETKSPDTQVRDTAYATLCRIVKPYHFTTVCGLWEETSEDDAAAIGAIRHVVESTLKNLSPDEKVGCIRKRMRQAANRMDLYYALLSSIPSVQAQEMLQEGAKSPNRKIRDAATAALQHFVGVDKK